MIEQVDDVWIVLDALDQCNTRKGSATEGIIAWVKALVNSEQSNIHLFVTSRPEQDIHSGLTDLAHDEQIIPLQSGLVSDDIFAYIRNRVREGDGLKRWRKCSEVQDEIETTLMQKANGM